MYNKGKYIVGEIMGSGNCMDVFGAIVFPEVISHDSVAVLFSDIRNAGFFSLSSDASKEAGILVEVHGGSASLGVSSNEDCDVLHVRRALGIAVK